MCDYVPDPIERMEARIEDLAHEWSELQRDVPSGSFRCPECRQVRNYEPISTSPNPDAGVCCYECLTDEERAAYDEFFGKGG